MGSQILELKWANHRSNMTSELQELYLNDALLDVTIACGEYSIKAHKTVLSASSTFFRKLFIDNPCQHPILIMTDVESEDLKTIVDFMYKGEIHISRDKLTHFLKIADRLKIKGLSSIEDFNLNPSEGAEVDNNSHTTCEAKTSSISGQSQDTSEAENIHSSPKNLTDNIQSDMNEEVAAIKLEHDLSSPINSNCTYWQSECFDQTSSSSVLPDCSLSSPSSLPLQLPTSASHHLPTLPASSLPHQLPTSSLSHQISASSSYQISDTSSSHQHSGTSPSSHIMPLNSERFAYSECQTDNGTITKENTGKDIIPVNLYQSQDQSSVTVSTGNKSFEPTESINNQSPLQTTKGDTEAFPNTSIFLNAVRTTTNNEEDIICASEGFNYANHQISVFSCKFCKMWFIKQERLQNHIKFHCRLKTFICEVCNSRFSTKNSLQAHVRIHTGEKPFACRICNKRFTQLCGLQYHERTHTGEKPFLCRVCHKQFSSKSVLQCHEKRHNGEKQFLLTAFRT